MNATSLSLVLDDNAMCYSIKEDDLKKVEHSIEQFKTELDNRRLQVKVLIREIFRLYARLNISAPSFHSLLSSAGDIDDVNNLVKEEKLDQLKKEKLDQLKK